MIKFHRGLVMAEYIVNNAIDWVEYFNDNNNADLTGVVEAFNNCREQGYILRIYPDKDFTNEEKRITFYVYNHRNTDLPTVSWDKVYAGAIYSEEAFYSRRTQFDTCEQAVTYIRDTIEKECL